MKANQYEYTDFDKFYAFPKLLKHRSDIMPIKYISCKSDKKDLNKKVVDVMKKILNLNGIVEFFKLGLLPNDSKVIDDIKDSGE